MKLHRLLVAALSSVLAVGTVVGIGTTTAQAQEREQYYLSVGDSYAVGYQPNGDLTHGFAQQLLPKAKKRGYDLTLVNVACGGATTESILNRKGCSKDRRAVGAKSYYPLTQAQAAAQFLRRHRGEVALVTISIGGNDITACGRGVPDPIQCVTDTVVGINENVTTLARDLRKAAGKRVRIVGTTYPDVLLGQWVREPVDQTIAQLSVVAFRQFINPALKSAYSGADGEFVDVTRATGAYGPLDDLVTLPPYGQIPAPVAEVCRLTWFCQKGDIHARTKGYGVIADLIAKRLPRKSAPGNG